LSCEFILLQDNLPAIHDALAIDLHRAPTETIIGDSSPVIHEAVYAYNNVHKWVKDIKPATTFAFQMMSPRIKPLPKGVVLIISPFNYPINVSFTPLIGAIAAGCVAVLKLSESLPTVSPLLAELIEKYLDPRVVRVVQGAADETSEVRLRLHTCIFVSLTCTGPSF
jgi:aldehyde dehydrogenase (NAD+)